MMKKGFEFKSLTTGTKFTFNLPYFDSVLLAQQYICNYIASLSTICATYATINNTYDQMFHALKAGLNGSTALVIRAPQGGSELENNVPVCQIVHANNYCCVMDNSPINLEPDTYEIGENSNITLVYSTGNGSVFCSTESIPRVSYICTPIICEGYGTARFDNHMPHFAAGFPCITKRTDNTLNLTVITLWGDLISYDVSSRRYAPKSAASIASNVRFTYNYLINKGHTEQPTISGDPTVDIDTETGESETQDSEENVGGAGNVTLINNIVNYDNYSPNYARVNTGFITPFEVDSTNLNTLHSFLYSETILDLIKNYFAGDATKAIVDLFNIPISPAVEPTSTEIKVGVIGTGAVGNVLTSETATFNFGSIDITQGYNSNSFMDLDPYNKYMIFLPFIGFKTLNTNDIRSINDTGFKIYLKYIVDMLTGDFVAVIEADHNNAVFDNDTGTLTTAKLTKQVINTFSGNMRTAIPLNSINSREAITPALGALATAIAGASTGNPLVMAQSVGSSLNSMANYNNALIPRGDSLSGNIGNLTINKAFVINQESPKYIRTGKSNQLVGYPVYKYMKITKDRGYVKVKDLIMSGFTGTAKEAEALEALLKGGVWTQ